VLQILIITYQSKNFRFLIELFRDGIVYRSMMYEVQLLIYLKINWISLTCTVGGLYKSHRLLGPKRKPVHANIGIDV